MSETMLYDLARRLTYLTGPLELAKPLVSTLVVTVHKCQVCKDNANARKIFSAIVLPAQLMAKRAPPMESEVQLLESEGPTLKGKLPAEFKILYKDFVGENALIDIDSINSIIFSLANLQESVTELCEDTE